MMAIKWPFIINHNLLLRLNMPDVVSLIRPPRKRSEFFSVALIPQLDQNLLPTTEHLSELAGFLSHNRMMWGAVCCETRASSICTPVVKGNRPHI